jgi:hypothetical protein
MPDLEFVMADSDRLRLLEWTFRQGARLVADLHYSECHYEEIDSVSKLQLSLPHPYFFVLRHDWQKEGLLMKPVVNKFKGPGFYIAQRVGGPALHYRLFPQRDCDGGSLLGGGTVGYYPFYYSSIDGGRTLAANQFLKGFYSDATGLLKAGGRRISVRVKGKPRSAPGFWVAQDAMKLLASKQVSAPEPWGGILREAGEVRG